MSNMAMSSFRQFDGTICQQHAHAYIQTSYYYNYLLLLLMSLLYIRYIGCKVHTIKL